MSEVKRINIKSNCNCGKKQIILEVNYSFNISHLQLLINSGFSEIKSYTNSGILYIEDATISAVGPFGSNRLNINCKNVDCEKNIVNLENLLKSF